MNTPKGAMEEDLFELESKLGYRFRDRNFLRQALVHRSYLNERRGEKVESNERLEFLGDAVLNLSVSHLIMIHYPDYKEGKLSKLRASIVNEKCLSQLSRSLHIGNFLLLGKGEERTKGRDKPSILADAIEAVLGAIYLDGGYEEAYNVIERHFLPMVKDLGKESIYRDYKTELQELTQERFKGIPDYRPLGETGPDHEKTFEVELIVEGKYRSTGQGKTKKEAEQMAAKGMLEKLYGLFSGSD